jgi:ring-1,2-phenylacetyl-CoA epoxidase subunit PaaE
MHRQTLKLIKRTQLTHDAFELTFAPLNAHSFQYKSGQFLTFLFPNNGHPFRRSYSLSSCEPTDTYPTITLKAIENGAASRILIQELHIGDTIESLPPKGVFVLDSHKNGRAFDLFLMAAGSGIGPIWGIIKDAFYNHPLCKIHLLYSYRDKNNAAYLNEFITMANNHPNRFRLVQIHSQNKHIKFARLNSDLLLHEIDNHLLNDKQDAQVFTCGPIDYMDMVFITLLTHGFKKDQLKKEHFEIEELEGDLKSFMNHVSYKAQLVLDGKSITIDLPPHTSILNAAIQSGIELPYSCKSGKCASCIVNCTDGKVLMSYNEVLTDKDISSGRILTCTGYAHSNITLDFDHTF